MQNFFGLSLIPLLIFFLQSQSWGEEHPACEESSYYLENQIVPHLGPGSYPPSPEHPNSHRGGSAQSSPLDLNRSLASSSIPFQSLWPSNDIIPLVCVQQALNDAPKGKENDYYNCHRDLTNPVKDALLRKSDKGVPTTAPAPCVTDNLVLYIHNEVNRALECVNSDGDILSSREVYGLLKTESGFMPNVRGWQAKLGGIKSYNGSGIDQLTQETSDFPSSPTTPVYKEWMSLKDNPQCDEFTKDRNFFPNNQANKPKISQCSMLNIEDNPARNIIMGLVGFKSNRKRILERFPENDRPQLLKEGGLIRVLSEIAYNGGYEKADNEITSLQKIKFINKALNTSTGENIALAMQHQVQIDSAFASLSKNLLNYYEKQKPGNSPINSAQVKVYEIINHLRDTVAVEIDALGNFVVNESQLENAIKSIKKASKEKALLDGISSQFHDSQEDTVTSELLEILKKNKTNLFDYPNKIQTAITLTENNEECISALK